MSYWASAGVGKAGRQPFEVQVSSNLEQVRGRGACIAGMLVLSVVVCPQILAGTPRILDVGDSWAFFPYALQSPPALEQVLARPEFGLGEYLEDGSIGLSNIFAYGWDTPEQLARIAERLEALPTLDICHVSIGGNDFVHGWKQFMTPTQEDALLDEITDHVRNVVQFCLDQRPDIRVAIVGYDYVNLYDGFMINAFDEVWDYESITHWAVTYWGYPIPATKAQVLEIVSEVHAVWVELERRKMLLAQEFGGRVSYIHNFGYVQHVYGVPNAGVDPGAVGVPDGPENGYANFPNGRPDLYNPRIVMKIDEGEMDPLHLNDDGFLAFMENVVRQCYAAWLTDSTPPTVVDIRPVAQAANPTDATELVFEIKFSEPVTGVDLSDFAVRTSDSVTGAAITGLSGSGATYLATVSGFSGAGTVALDLIDDDTIYDAVWYPLRRLQDGSFRTGRSYWLGGGLLDCPNAALFESQGESLYAGVLGESWTTADLDGNGITDRFELALTARLACDPGYPAREELVEALAQARATLESETSFASWASQADALAAICIVSPGLRDAIITAMGLEQEYEPFAVSGAYPLSAAGDPDADARSNLIEYDWVRGLSGGRVEYAIAAATAGCGPLEAPACPDPTVYDTEASGFYVALGQGVEWKMADWGDNGVPDRFELALANHVLCDGRHSLHDPLQIVQGHNVAALEADPAAQLLLPYGGFLSLFAALGQATADQVATDMGLTAALTGLEYGAEEPFDPDADLDGDGASNYREYIWALISGGSPEDYAAAAADAARKPNAAIPNCDVAVTFENQGGDFYEFAFETGAWQIADADVSGIPDRFEISVLAALMCDTTHPLHAAVTAAYEQNLEALRDESGIPFLAPVFDIMAALATLSHTFSDLLATGLSLQNTYHPFELEGGEPLSSLGDLDLDGRANLTEYADVGGASATEPEYVLAVLGTYYPPAPELVVDPLCTNDPLPRITGTACYAVSLELSLDGIVWSPVIVDGHDWRYSIPEPLADGVYDVRVRAVGAYDREGQDGTTDELIIDTVPPEILLIGPDRMVAEAAEPYEDPGVLATDNREGDLTPLVKTVNSVNTLLIDSFVVTFSVSDTAGNAAMPVFRVVEVRDRTVPVITLLGSDPLTVEAAEPFIDPGATASDSFSGDLTGAIQVSGVLDTAVPGTYVIHYDVRDANRNDALTVSRTVEVVDTTPPVVTLLGGAEVTVPALQAFVEPGATAVDAVDGVVDLIVDGFVDTGVPGTNPLAYSAADRSGNLSEPVVRLVQVVDTGAPEITIVGENPLTHEAATEYQDPGASARDAVEGDLTAAIVTENGVDAAHPGEYAVTYRVADGAGNTDEKSRTVRVMDTTPPVITLRGEPSVVHEAATGYTDAGATALDTVDGDLTSEIDVENGVDAQVLGECRVNYAVTDAAGNEGTAVRTVVVVDTTPPVIALAGASPMVHEAGVPFADPGATAIDSWQGDLTAAITTESTVNENQPGAYSITYRVSDSEGNEATPVTRTVQVTDSLPPDLVLIGGESLVIRCFDHFVEPGVTAFDLVDGDRNAFVVVDGQVLDHVPGTYVLTYRVNDSRGNAALLRTREVTILDDCNNAADQDRSFSIELTELLRVIQFYNSGAHHCALGTEDGYAPGAGEAWCPPHSLDYSPMDWRIELFELLRAIQFYNARGCYPCPDAGTEDGYCLSPEIP